jgi:hypothetical protein
LVAVGLIIAALFESTEIALKSAGIGAVLGVSWALFAILAALVIFGRKKTVKKYQYLTVESPPMMPGVPQSGLQSWPSQANSAKFCAKCGNAIEDPQRAVFCNKCGQRLIQPIVTANPSDSQSSTNFPPPPGP